MLCPEVWNFDPTPHSASTKFCQSEEDIFRTIKHDYFNHHVSLILPNTLQISEDFTRPILGDNQYYKINKVPIAEFARKDFVDYFVKKGRLTAVSLNESFGENSLVFTPCGKLILSLSKSTFHELGVEGTFTKHSNSALKKYIVVSDLASNLNESNKKREQIHKKLAFCKNLNFDIILAWEPGNSNVCPSSIALYFSQKGYFVKTCDVTYQKMLKYNVAVPLYDDDIDAFDMIEWLGAFSLDCDMSNNDYISSLKCPERNEEFGQVMRLSFTGLITHDRLKKFISEIMKYIEAKSSPYWISLSVQNFQDSVLSVKNKELYLSGGDHHRTLIFKWNSPTLVYTFQDRQC